MPAAEAELEAFRNEWRAEVSARAQQDQSVQRERSNVLRYDDRRRATYSAQAQLIDLTEELEPKSYHDLPDKDEEFRLKHAGQNHDRYTKHEPVSALEHYERAVEKESQGQLGDSIRHYRKAFKMDDDVHELYKNKHFPSQPRPPKQSSTTIAAAAASQTTGAAEVLPTNALDLIASFADLAIEAPPPATSASPLERSMLGELPEEILVQVLLYAAMSEVASMARLALVCKRLAYLSVAEERIWKELVLHSCWGMSDMLYRFTCDVDGHPLQLRLEEGFSFGDYEDDEDKYREARLFAQSQTTDYALASMNLTQELLRTRFANSWRQMFRSRPRIRFNGCYISTVNYTRAGGNNTNTLSWGVPVHVVTYYRYLRFFRDGTVISLLTTTEPADVVHHLLKDNLHHHHGNTLPSAVMRTALRGRWRLTGPLSSLPSETENPDSEGEVVIETQGSTSRYIFEMRLALANAGKGARNNKLAWRSYLSRNRLTDDSAQFTLKHDKGFYWSRVNSYT